MAVQEPKIRNDGLQITDHPRFQRTFWRVERLAWIGFVVIIIGALFGLTGAGGPLSARTLRAGGAEITYTHIARWQTTHTVSIRMPPAGAVDPVVSISESQANDFTIDTVMPQPTRVEASAGAHRYHFAGQTGASLIVFEVTPRQPGIYRHDLAVDGQHQTLTTYVLP